MKPRPKILDRIIAVIDQCQTFCVVNHVRPDGDSVGSQLGLTMALQNEGKTVTCWNADEMPRKLAFLDPQRIVQRPRPNQAFDCVIALDVASLERLGAPESDIANRTHFINIDHHPSNTRFADINWVVPRSPSTGELVYRLLRAANWPVSPAIADCLFTAVSTDTGSFQYPSTRPNTYVIAGDLVKRGANLANICNEVYQSYPLSRVRLMQHILNHFKLVDDDRIAYYWLKPDDFTRTGANASDSEGLIDHVRAIEPVVIACQFEQVAPQVTCISLRSKREDVDVGQVALQFNGGGHKAAAGARIEGNPISVQRRVLIAIKKALRSK